MLEGKGKPNTTIGCRHELLSTGVEEHTETDMFNGTSARISPDLGTAFSLRVFLLHLLLVQAIGLFLSQSATTISILRRTSGAARRGPEIAVVVVVRGSVCSRAGRLCAVGFVLLLVKEVGSGDGHLG